MTEAVNPFGPKNDEPAVRESITVYLDILGYRARMQAAESAADENRELVDLRKAVDDTYRVLKGQSMPLWIHRTFTDNIVVGFPTNRGYNSTVPELRQIFSLISIIQLKMIRYGWFLRGGIAVGNLYVDDNIVFGSALLEAIKAEQEQARDPRIVLAPSAEQLIMQQFPTDPNGFDGALLRDVDGMIFLNYLGRTVFLHDADNEPNRQWLTEHREMIKNRLALHKDTPRVWTKYAWTGHYHNFFCDKHSDFDDSYKVSQQELPTVPRLLSDS